MVFPTLHFRATFIIALICSGIASSACCVEHIAVGEITQANAIVQTFTATGNNLTSVSVRLATYDRQNSASLSLTLRDLQANKVVARRTLDDRTLTDNELTALSFLPLRDSMNKKYEFRLESQDGKPGNSVTAWRLNEPNEGLLLVGNAVLPGHLDIELKYSPLTLLELTEGISLRQVFTCSLPFYCKIGIPFKTFDRANQGVIRIELRQLPLQKVIASRFLSVEKLPAGGEYIMPFYTDPFSKGKSYELLIAARSGVPGNSVAVALDGTQDGMGLTINSESVPGRIVLNHYFLAKGFWTEYASVLSLATGFILGLIIVFILCFFLSTRHERRSARIFFGDLYSFVYKRRLESAMLLIIYILYMILSQFNVGTFPDELDNILGGQYILEGRLPYRDFFSQHMPLPYYIAAVLAFFSGKDLFVSRAFLGFFFYLWGFGIYLLLRSHLSKRAGLLFFFLLPQLAAHTWGHMLLAESLISYSSIVLLILFMLRFRVERLLTKWDIAAVSLSAVVISLSSLGWIFLVILVYVSLIGLYVLQFWKGGRTVSPVFFGFIVAGPYVLLLAHLAYTGAINSFIFSNYEFNKIYYAQYQGQTGDILPIILARIATAGAIEAKSALEEILRQPSNWYLQLFGVLSFIVCTAYFLSARKYGLWIFYVAFIVLAGPRGSLATNWARNWHGAPVIIVGFLMLLIVLQLMLNRDYERRYRMLIGTIFSAGCVSLVFPIVLLTGFTAETSLNLMFVPEIHSQAQPFPCTVIVNKLTDRNDYVWVIPFDYGTLSQVHCKQGVYSNVLVPWVSECQPYMEHCKADVERLKPKIIVWHYAGVWGEDMDVCLTDLRPFIEKRYFKVPNPDLKDYYFLKERQTEIVNELKAKGYLATDFKLSP